MKKQSKTVFVGLSGGVDSSLSALLLKKQGYKVVGVFIKTWHPDFIECTEEEERLDAMRVAAHLNIPFLTFDFEDVYKKEVADYMISEYKLGRIPNPDVMCNKHVKFGAFLKKSLSMGADFVATGHYAQNKKNTLVKGVDPSKDQSYFLWTLNQKQISKILFPVGHLKKREVRILAKKFNLPVADKKDSQGICFLGDIDLKEFLGHYIKTKRGKVLNTSGKQIGHHNGALFFTVLERHGFTITKKSSNDLPYYVISKDIKKNTITVSNDKNSNEKGLIKNIYKIKNTNWIKDLPKINKKYTAQVRYHGEQLPCTIELNKKGNTASIVFTDNVLVSPGQSIVVYNSDICMGGGTVL